MTGFFAGIGRICVRYRWLVLAVWAGGTALALLLLPSLSGVTQSDTSSFLPASAPSERAQALAAPLQGAATLTSVTVVAAAHERMDAAGLTAIGSLSDRLARVTHVVSVRPAGVSADGEAEQLTVLAALPQSVGVSASAQAVLCADLRAAIRPAMLPRAMVVHLAGQVATRVDNNAVGTSSGSKVQWVSIAFVIVLLVCVFRSVLAPVVAVIPAAAVVLIAERLTALAAVHLGLGISQIASLLLIVLVLGAGTDYALFLMFRVREMMQNGQACSDAIGLAVSRVGETITFSAGVLIAALGSLAFATFPLYSGLAAPLSIGIGLMLLAGLTLLPALLAVLGPVAFWPSSVRAGARAPGWWGQACARIVRRPVTVLVLGLALFGGLAVAAGIYQAAGFGGPVAAPPGSDSAAGDVLLAAHFPATAVNPTLIVLRLRTPIWSGPASVFAAEQALDHDRQFTVVNGPFDPEGATLSVRAFEAARRTSGPFVSSDGRTVGFATQLAAGNATTTAASLAVPAVRADAARAGALAGAETTGVTGQPAFTYDVAQLSDGDLHTVIPIAIAVIAVLLALVMRSLVAPLYLIASVVLSYFSALGLTALVFMRAAGQPGLTFILPFLLFVFLLALGEDYNILVMTRIREEAATLPLREAVGRALSVTGTTVTSAGLVLALTFGVLAVVGSASAGPANVRTVVDVGVGLALGVLMDTFLVRTLLVPSAVILIGRWNWWPS
ncbi:MAG TPA: MMPL family transporter, partial [Streptosporangiaceae bacterium]